MSSVLRKKNTERKVHYGRATLSIVGGLMIAVSTGCTNHDHSSPSISATLSMSSYALVRQHASYNRESAYYFPMLEIYTPSGLVVCKSHESAANAKVLMNFPDSVRDLPPQEQEPRIEKILNEIPEFKARQQEIGANKWVILSIALQQCEACEVQDNAMQQARKRLLKNGTTQILEIQVTPP